jgi:1-acyl-sn-glycerol-3-phosphate acyltransferase
MPTVTPIRPGEPSPIPAPFADLREELGIQRVRVTQARGILDTLEEHLVDADGTTSSACGGASALLERVEHYLSGLSYRLERGEVKP